MAMETTEKDQLEIDSNLSHDDLLEITKSSLSTLISTDEFLKDLPSDVLIEEILAQVIKASVFS